MFFFDMLMLCWAPANQGSMLRSIAMLPCSFLISQHPEVEARIAEELRSEGLLATPQQPQPRALEHADLSKLAFLSCAVKVRRSASRRVASDVALLCPCAMGQVKSHPDPDPDRTEL